VENQRAREKMEESPTPNNLKGFKCEFNTKEKNKVYSEEEIMDSIDWVNNLERILKV
jgi:hypothetical protein